MIYRSVNDADLDFLPFDSSIMNFVDTSHGMGSVKIEIAGYIRKRIVCACDGDCCIPSR